MDVVLLRCWAVLLSLALTGCSGLGTSRWAMDNPEYAEKYGKPYDSRPEKKIPRMLKQMGDARQMKGSAGAYFGGIASNSLHPLGLGGEVAAVIYPESWLSTRVGLMGLVDTGTKQDADVGVTLGAQIQAPTRLAPYVGVTGFAGWSSLLTVALDDSDSAPDPAFPNSSSSNSSTTTKQIQMGIFGVAPEVGLHFWLNTSCRLSASAGYMFASEGRPSDFAYYGFGITLFKAKDRFGDNDDFPIKGEAIDVD